MESNKARRPLPFVTETVKKRVRLALDAGDNVTARKEIRMVLADDDDVEAYLKHLEEEKAQQDREEFERMFSHDGDDSDILVSALESLSLDRSIVPCPVCEKGNLQEESDDVIMCSVCDLKLTVPGGLTRISDLLSESCEKGNLQEESDDVIMCSVCDLKLTVPGGLTRISDLLSESLSQHANECTSKQRPTFALENNQLSLRCEVCQSKIVIS